MKRPICGDRLKQGILSILLPAFALSGGPIQANPSGGVVVHGAADIARISSNQLRIHQQSNAVIINWQDFSIGQGDVTRFVQPNRGTALNRVVSGNISEIHGQLKANANVYVINPNGILIGAGGVIDVGGNAVLSTLDVDNDDFLNGGDNRFHGRSNTGVSNFGSVSSANGDVVLLGGFVDNQGQLGAMNGTVAIGAGGDILLHEGGGSKISVRGASDYDKTGINNSGTIRGASAELKAHGNVYALAINNGGAIRATGADRSSGRVLLRASGGSSNINTGSRSSITASAGADGGSVEIDAGQGRAVLAGRIDANGSRSGGSVSVVGREVEHAATSAIVASGEKMGGSVSLDASETLVASGSLKAESSAGVGGQITVTSPSLVINDGATHSVNGFSGGGRIREGGDFQGRDTGLREADSVRVAEGAILSADSMVGNGGTVIVWANTDTLFLGEVSASAKDGFGNGGLVEVSGKKDLYFDGQARVGTVGGEAGLVLFDPGDVVVGAAGATVPPLANPVLDSVITISSVNDTLQSGAHVLIVTESGDITFAGIGGGGSLAGGATAGNRHAAIQWTNSQSSFGAFASDNIYVNNNIRTSGAGSINLIAGWGGAEADSILSTFDPESAWDFYVAQGKFGVAGGSVVVGNTAMDRHIEVGTRFGDTNLAGYDVRVNASSTAASLRYAQVGFHDSGQVFAPVLDKGGAFRLDMTDSTNGGRWFLSDGVSVAGTGDQPVAGVADPIAAVAGRFEVDVNGDGIMDGVNGINSTGRVSETFIPYANHYNSADSGNWWWQQIEDAGKQNAANPGLNLMINGVVQTADPLLLGGLRPENGAGSLIDGADINVVARGNVAVSAGAGSEQNVAMIGHGGPNRANVTGSGTSLREVGNEDPSNAAFSNAGIQGGQLERRWSFNGTTGDLNAVSIARLAPVRGNINVLAGVDTTSPVFVNRGNGTISASFTGSGNVVLRANPTFKVATPSSNSPAQIGHGGIGQFGEYFGDIRVEAGGNVVLQAGEATRSAAVIGHTFYAHSYWNPTSVADQQLRFFATAGDFDNTNLRRGELFSGAVTTGFDPAIDPARTVRYTLAQFTIAETAPGSGVFAVTAVPGTGNFVPIIDTTTGIPTGRFQNINQPTESINMSPLLYSQGLAGGGAFGTAANSQGRGSVAPLTLAPTHVGATPDEIVPGLHGSVVSGLHGDVTVVARNGDVTLTGYSTDGITGNFGRESRFAKIGHGGVNASNTGGLGSGYQGLSLAAASVPGITSAGIITGNVEGREIVDMRMVAGNEITGSASRSEIGGVGSAANRGHMFMTLTGDIDVRAGRDLTMTAGNDIQDFTQIGHGGAGPDGGTFADYESSSFILGDIRVSTGRDLTVTGGGGVTNLVRGGDFSMRAWSHIGHGGRRTGFLGFIGDIDVSAGGNVLVQNGAHRWTYAKIGHQGVEDLGQAGGEFVRNEHFIGDRIQTTIASSLLSGSAAITYGSATGGINRTVDLTSSGAGTLVGAERNTANVSVSAGGSVTLTHLQEGIRQPIGRTGTLGDPDNRTGGIRVDDSYAQIGHGGVNLHTYLTNSPNNPGFNFKSKTGNVSVEALGGNVTLENGAAEHRWTRIGHGVGLNDIVTDNSGNLGISRAIELAGNITVTAAGNIDVNAGKAAENERAENTDAPEGSPFPSRRNPVVIGHGGIYNNTDVVVLGKGELIGGIASSSNISVTSGGNLSVVAGKGTEASFAQIGHGFTSNDGGDFSRRLGVATGFAGDIGVRVGGSLLVLGGQNAWSELPGSLDNEGVSVTGAFAAIGHGGYQLDAPSSGNINVYVANDMNVIAQQRTDPGTTLVTGVVNGYTIVNRAVGSGAVASAFNFAKVGHFAVENGEFLATAGDIVSGARQDGDITVVVGRDLRVIGGTTPNVDTQTIFGAFAQIGHGGPGISGDLDGDITVLVKRNLAVTAGTERGPANISVRDFNNYAMIGNGDYLRDVFVSLDYIFGSRSQGNRFGNIDIAAGENATFNGALVGHSDPLVSGLTDVETSGYNRVAVSRNNPFFGGRGRLTAVNETIFTSGGIGREQMEFYIPSRSMNSMSSTTRVNETTETFVSAPADFAAPFNKANGNLAGRADEVYLTPDLWWDQTGQAAKLGVSGAGLFPTDSSGAHGGAIATVNSPGGLPGLDSLAPGDLGSSATVYRNNHAVSGAGLYTLYYDSIEESLLPRVVVPDQPVAPIVPIPVQVFDFFGLSFSETYDAFFREEDLEDGIGGSGDELYRLLGLFERDEMTEEESGSMRIENALDNVFGDSRDSNSEEEQDEEERSRIARASSGGPVGMSFYIFEPGTNRYSSYRVFGHQSESFYPVD